MESAWLYFTADYQVAPKSLSEVLSLLSRYGERAKVFAGGSETIPKMKRREIQAPEYLIKLKNIPGLDYIYIPKMS